MSRRLMAMVLMLLAATLCVVVLDARSHTATHLLVFNVFVGVAFIAITVWRDRRGRDQR